MSSRKRKLKPASKDEKNEVPAPKTLPRSKAKGRYRLCSVPNCTKQVQQGGVCCRHGAKTTRASCSADGCTNFAKRGGLCRKHGAFQLETCAHQGCKRVAKQGAFCDNHTVVEVCTVVNSTSTSSATGRSKKRRVAPERSVCVHGGCTKKAVEGIMFCRRHEMELSNGFQSGQVEHVDHGDCISDQAVHQGLSSGVDVTNTTYVSHLAPVVGTDHGEPNHSFLSYFEDLFDPLPG